MKSITLTAPDQHPILAYIWEHPSPIGWIHICHGMAEHALRYDRIAQILVSNGYSVVAHNHRGHGQSNAAELGHYSDQDGWTKVLQDVGVVRDNCTEAHIPYYLFGHSMGSFIAQAYLATQPKPIDGLILSGSKWQSGLLSIAGSLVAKLERLRVGRRGSSKLIDTLSFGAFNNDFKPCRTEYDWLSKDSEEVDKYINDPYCGFSCSAQLWADLLDGLTALFKQETINRIQADLPILMFGGDKDPVGESGKALPKLNKAYLEAGQKDVTLELYPDGRHEMLNETNRDQVAELILNWLDAHMASNKAS